MTVFESKSMRTLRQAQGMLDKTKEWLLLKQRTEGLDDVDRKQARREMDRAGVLYERSLGESHESFLGDFLAALKLLFTEGRLFPTEAQLAEQYRDLERQKDVLLESLKADIHEER